jgi:type IV pilus assembly protein PilQ
MQVSAAINLDDIVFSELPGGKVEIKASFSGKPDIPKGYSIQRPARIVLDLPNVNSALSQKKYALDLGNLKTAVVLTAKERTRLILNLVSIVSYSSRVENNELIIVVGDQAKATVSTKASTPLVVEKVKSSAPTTSAPTSSGPISSRNEITEIDFRRDENGAGTLLLSLSNPKIPVSVERKAKNISLSFLDASVAESLRRRLDVIDFTTPVTFIETRQQNGSVTISIETKGDYDYIAYQADEKYVVNISPLTPKEAAEREDLFEFVGERLSLNFQDIEVRKVLEIIADFTELNLVASDTVAGNITLRLENVPWDQALELVLKSKGLDKRQSGNVLLVAPAAEIAERERHELESKKQIQELEPLVTEFIRIRYAKATDVLELIKPSTIDGQQKDNALSARGTALVDERTNSMILTDIAMNVQGIRKLIEQIDVPVRQVMIEARIVSATDGFQEALGFSLSSTASRSGGQLNSVGSTSTSFGAIPNSTFNISYLSSDIFLSLELEALETSGFGEVISQPRVLTGDKQKAKIASGQQIPFTSSDGDTVTTIFQDAVLSLEVTPQITPDNSIIMELKINRDSLDESTETLSGFPINITELTTTALVGDGETIVLGGIYEQTKSTDTSKVPLLGDIPVLGRLFSSKREVDNKTELLIFITPRIMPDSLIDN